MAHTEEALVEALKQCGGAAMLLEATIIIVCLCSNFFNHPSAVSLVIAMVSATRAQVVAKEVLAIRKALELESRVIIAKVAKATPAPARMEKALPSVLHKGNMEGTNSHVTFPPPLPSPPHKRGRLISDGAHRCCRRVDLGMVPNGTDESKLFVEVEGMLRVPRSLQPSVASGAINAEDSLPTPEIRMHIAIEVVCLLRLAQETRSLSDEEFSLVEFLLHQIALKEVVAQQVGVVPLIFMKIVGHKQVSLPLVMSISDHQSPLVCSDSNLGNTKTCVACTSLSLPWSRCGKDVKAIPPDLSRLLARKVSDKQDNLC
jgi:hypothetical protein